MLRMTILVAGAAAMAGCSTATRGTKQNVRFESEPLGATVIAARVTGQDSKFTCKTPCTLKLSRKRDFTVTYELEGYKTATARLASRLGAKGAAAAVPGNFLAGGGVGFIVDASTGANMQLKPDPMRAKLAPIDSDEESIVYDERIEGSSERKNPSS